MSAGPVTLYGLKNCDSCKKALKELDASDRETAFVDIREDADLDRLLPAWLKASPTICSRSPWTRSTRRRSCTRRGQPAGPKASW